jgi:putative sugar O-methyltransferase
MDTNPKIDECQQWYHRITNKRSSKGVTDIWENNIERLLVPIIDSNESFAKKLSTIHKTNLYSLQPEASISSYHLQWHLSLLKNNKFNLWDRPKDFCEHPIVSSQLTQVIDNKLLSPDFATRAHYLNEIEKHIDFEDRHLTFAELGAGFGSLARVLKLRFKNASYLIFDLPETLYFSAAFLQNTFPDAKILLVEKDTDVSNYKHYDFIFVPTGMEQKFSGIDVDLFLNTHSLGEMTNNVIQHWVRFIEQEVRTKNIFMLNRFMNPLLQKNRLDENQSSLLFGREWDILRWEFEPDFERCPYNEITANPNLLLIAKWEINDNKDSDYYSKKSDELLDKVKKQDWYQIVSSNDYRTKSFAATIFSFILLGIIRVLPQSLVILAKKATYWKKQSVKAAFIYNVDERMIVHPIISGRLTDYKMSSTIFELWESIRLNPTRDNFATMIKYLEFLSVGKFQQYEEYFYYKSRHKDLN